MRTIFIDTTSNQEITVSLTVAGKTEIITKPLERQKAQVLLPMIIALLAKHQLTLKDLTDIKVHTGPGSFTGVRVGVSIANALSYALGIPVNTINVQTADNIVEPLY